MNSAAGADKEVTKAAATVELRDAHLAFRTITTLLSVLRLHKYEDVTKRDLDLAQSDTSNETLSLSVCFSILAALEHEVVATVVKWTVEQKLEVIISYDCSVVKRRRPRQPWSILFSPNHRRTAYPPELKQTRYPRAEKVEAPIDLTNAKGNNPKDKLNAYIRKLR